MRIDILTLIPGTFDRVFEESILGAAKKAGTLDIRLHNFREFSRDRHKTVDDAPFGGGPGMLIKPEPLVEAIRTIRKDGPPAPVFGLTPQGIPLSQPLVKRFARFERLILVCGRYEGFDDRLLSEFDAEISVGDYVLTGGEFAAMTIVDAVSRMIPGTVGRSESVQQDSFFTGPLDHPQYTRPAVWEHRGIPEVLRQGHHQHIEDWRRGQALLRTATRRPDVFSRLALTRDDGRHLQAVLRQSDGSTDSITKKIQEGVHS